MKSAQLIFTFLVAVMLKLTCAIDTEWQPSTDVGFPDHGIVHPNSLRRLQLTTELSSTGSTSSASASAASSTTETEAPTTIMVLLPDNLAPSYSGSGSVMFFDGSVGGEHKSMPKGSSAEDEGSNTAARHNFGVAMALLAASILSILVIA
ncbi:unnamed protein product [Phytophthora lilii]|uniref:Unnamed protein product n=1 Tax=Phytophthora lilii TaxID=2077276 RepID=A0A9W6TR83_9STRA|nr:unnamed protein product [Phytophthora lilii]